MRWQREVKAYTMKQAMRYVGPPAAGADGSRKVNAIGRLPKFPLGLGEMPGRQRLSADDG